MESAIRRFLTHLEQEREAAENTILAYEADLRQLDSVLQSASNESVTPANLNQQAIHLYSTWLNRQGYRPSTVSRKMAAVRSFLDYLSTEEQAVDLDLIDELDPPSIPRRKPRVLTREEIERLLQAPAGSENARRIRDYAILNLLYATGLRATEAVALNLENVDPLRGLIIGAPNRDQPLSLGRALLPIRRYLKVGRPGLARSQQERAFLLNQRGKRLSRQGLWLVVKRWAEAADLGDDISPHTLRHTRTHNLLARGKSKREVQTFLGLSSPNAIYMGQDSIQESSWE
jgi:integrase/recombinase XerD